LKSACRFFLRFGEQVKAIVQLHDHADSSPTLEAELISYCQARLSKFKVPRSIEFEPNLPRNALGKLMKKELKQRYWPPAKNLVESGL
jgi:acyl-coenzyme A synthetase/AMP-(fatty) acid ligase